MASRSEATRHTGLSEATPNTRCKHEIAAFYGARQGRIAPIVQPVDVGTLGEQQFVDIPVDDDILERTPIDRDIVIILRVECTAWLSNNILIFNR